MREGGMTQARVQDSARTRARWFGALIVSVLAARGAAAQDLPEDLTQLPLEQLMTIDLVYGASRHEQKVTEAPSFVSVITSSDIGRYGYRTLADVLRSVHGFYTTYDRNYTYLGVRGFSRPSDYNTRFLLLIDGHRINDNFYGTAYVGTEEIIDVDLIDRVEIIRGPSSSLYGTSAFFAVINVVTKKPSGIPRLRVSATDASYGTPGASVAWAQQFEGGPSILAAGSAYNSAGRSLFYKEYDDPQNNNGVFERGDGDRYYRFFGTASLRDFTVQAAFNSRDKVIPTGAFSTPFNDPNTRTLDERGYLDVKYERALSGGASVLARLSYDSYYYRGTYPYYSPYPTILTYKEHSWGDWLGAEAKYTLKPGAWQTLTTGLEVRDNVKQRFRWKNVDPGPLDFDDTKRSREGGAYVQDEIAPSKKVTFNLGVRRDQDETFGGSTSPRAALIWSPTEHSTVKGLFGDAFRAPTVYELYYGAHANADLNPESIRTTEVVLEEYARSNIRLAGSAYIYRIHDLISVDTVSGLFENIDQVEARGIEVEVEKHFRRGWRLRYSSTLQETRDQKTRDLLTNSPRHLAKLNADFPLRGETLVAGIEAQYTSTRLTQAGNDDPGFTIVNLTLLTRHLARGLDLSASVYNLFGRTYADPGSEHHVQDTIEQDGRNYRLKLTWGF